MLVSVVIPTYNRAGSLRDVHEALRRQTRASFEVVIVNGPSTDGTAEYVASLGDAVRGLENPERNLSRSRNLGIEAANGELVAFLDDDAVPEPRWLEQLVAAFDDERVAGAGGLVLDHTGVRVQWRHLVTSRAGEHDFDQLPPLDRFVGPGADPFLYVAGGNCAFRRDALDAIEGFDEEIEYNFDEAEVCLRLLDAGWRLESLDGAVVHHRNLPSHQRSALAFTDPFFAVKNRVYFGLRYGGDGRDITRPLASANRDLGRLREAARAAARGGRMTERELAHHLGRADAGFHVGVRRGLAGGRRGRRFRPPDAAALRPFPVLAPPRWRRVALLAPAPGTAARLAAAGHEVHELRPSDPAEPYRIDFDAGVWLHTVPVASRWLPELEDAALRRPLEEAAAIRAAVALLRARGPVEVEGELAFPRDVLLEAGQAELAELLERKAALEPAAAARAARRLLEPHRFPYDHEPAVRACLAEPQDDAFVRCLYAALLGREPDPFGSGTLLAGLQAGEERITLVERVARSTEARRRGIDPTFVGMARFPDVSLERAQAGLRAAWLGNDAAFVPAVHRLLVGAGHERAGAPLTVHALSRHELVAALARRPEVRERVSGVEHLPPCDARTADELRAELDDLARRPATAFIAAAYRTLLGRAPDPQGAAAYASELASGRSRAWVVCSLAASPEGAARGLPPGVVEAIVRRSPAYLLDGARRRLRRRVRRLSARLRRR